MMLCAVDFLHSVGHVLAGRLVGSPMAVNLVTATRDVAVYARPGSSASRRERLGRALGGPALNLLCGILALPLGHIIGGDWLGMFGLFNLCIGVWTLLPIPTLDGAVIWGALLGTERD
jgi:Zn-dependent protease